MLDMGFKRQIDLCVHHATMARDRCTLMFSATFANEIQWCAREYLQRSHLFLQVGIVGGACSGQVCVGRVGNTGRAASFVNMRADAGVIPQLVNRWTPGS